MNYFDRLKYGIRNNLLTAGILDDYYSRTLKKRIVIQKYVKKFCKIDSILNFNLFQKKLFELKKKSYDFYCSSSRFQDVSFYGYYQALLDYSCYKKRKYPILTGIEHGIRFGEKAWKYYPFHTCYVCQGKERISEISDLEPTMPILTIGPYIFYSKPYYSKEKSKELKEKYGRTLLVFPSHTCECDQEKESNDLSELIRRNYKDDFQTIMVCLYWRDVNQELIEQFTDLGAVIVSAGFRNDTKFIQRLKSIIDLADLVVVDDIGTNIGFALCMNKKVIMLGDPKQTEDKVFQHNFNEFYKAFHPAFKYDFTEEQVLKQKDLYERFWGASLSLTKDEMYQFFSLFDKLIRSSHMMTENVKEIIQSELKSQNILNKKEIALLKGVLKF